MAAIPDISNDLEKRLEQSFLQTYVPGRKGGLSYGEIADKLRITLPELMKHVRRFQWKRRYDEIARKSAAMLADRVAETMADVDERHLKNLREVQDKAMKCITEGLFDDPVKCAPILERLIKLERSVLQLDDAEKDTDDLPTRIAKQLQKLQKASGDAPQLKPSKDFEFDAELANDPPPLPEPDDNTPEPTDES